MTKNTWINNPAQRDARLEAHSLYSAMLWVEKGADFGREINVQKCKEDAEKTLKNISNAFDLVNEAKKVIQENLDPSDFLAKFKELYQ